MGIKKFKIIFIFLIVVTTLFGFVYGLYIWNKSLEETSSKAIQIAKIAEIGINGEMFKQLRAIPEDIGTLPYESIKQRLVDLMEVNKSIRFAYIYVKRGEKLYFAVDSEPSQSKDYSPPGQEFTEADPQIYQPFIDGQTMITKPATDRWGTWVSVLVPMKDFKTGETLAVFGMDYPASRWEIGAITNTIQTCFVFIILIVLLFAFYRIFKKENEIKENEEKFKAFSESTQDAIVIMDGEGRVTLWNKTAEKMFGYSESEMLGKEFLKYITVKKEHEDKTNILKFGHTGESAVIDKTIELPVKNRGGEEFTVELSVSKVLLNNKWHAIGIMRNVTKRKEVEESLSKLASEKTKALEEAERLNKLMVGRELEMVELKKEIARLKEGK